MIPRNCHAAGPFVIPMTRPAYAPSTVEALEDSVTVPGTALVTVPVRSLVASGRYCCSHLPASGRSYESPSKAVYWCQCWNVPGWKSGSLRDHLARTQAA